ncbi:hypothetical protein EDD18DRAFT_1348413 [Armillaria luteobubalina]|uniref:Uncharacterized protein n=1 Tax=Armillaria luteobubalina TaxID=153913 RepID=A0AA39QEU3_9AGAR|nr:hypothetical protein EDD18DRAFT_1348413 [Armillaria luteobubalina]
MFGQVWVLECRHILHTDCAYQLLEHRTTRSFLPRPPGSPSHVKPVAKVWTCPVATCLAVYRSVHSRRTHGWTIPQDSEGCIRALQPYTHGISGKDASSYESPRSTLEDLESLSIKLCDLHQGMRGPRSRLAPISVEYATERSLSHVPPITVSIASIVSSLSGSVRNSYVIDAIVAETLANRPPTPPEWPPHLDSFRDDLALTELSDHNMVLIVPGYINLKPEKKYVSIWLYWDASTKSWLGLDLTADLIRLYQKDGLCGYLI